MRIRGDREAFGGPGMPPRWSHANKDGVGTAYSGDSKVWFTIFRGSITEVYYPRIDHPQLRDLQYLVSDGATFFHEDRRHLTAHVDRLSDHALGYAVEHREPTGRYAIEKEVISAPHLPVILQRTVFSRDVAAKTPLKLYALCAPHLNVAGWGNTGLVVEHDDRLFLAAERDGTWLAMGTTAPIARASAGFVGVSDGWTDLKLDNRMDWEFDRATNGNVALMGEIDVPRDGTFTLGLAFGHGLSAAMSALSQALGTPYEEHRRRFLLEWDRPHATLPERRDSTGDAGRLYRSSVSLLLAHEDKTYPGAVIASLSIPWGNVRMEEDRGGYHLVWTRDLVKVATGLLAAGDLVTPLRTLIYLSTIQRPDGGFAQNSWLDGSPFWSGVQLDEVAFPILLAWKLERADALGEFDPYPMVRAAARYLVLDGPVTGQERWEEASGYSPSTLAVHIAALVAAAGMARRHGDRAGATVLEEYSDFLNAHLERWTVTNHGTLDPERPRHFVRIHPIGVDDVSPIEDLETATLTLANQPPGAVHDFRATEVVDGGFLELVRHGVRRATDAVVADSVAVVDKVLKVDTPFGPVWRRYNHDGYGQRDDGGPYTGWGVGRAWPLLTGERGHYEVAAGRDASSYRRTMERLATTTGLLAEQVWDGADHPEVHLKLGRPTGSAMPLAWAHAEYLTLLRSIEDKMPFDLVPAVAERCATRAPPPHRPEVWTFSRQPRSISATSPLRILAGASFRWHGSTDGWKTVRDVDSTGTAVGLHFLDLPPTDRPGDRIDFTFYWPDSGRWEGRDFSIALA